MNTFILVDIISLIIIIGILIYIYIKRKEFGFLRVSIMCLLILGGIIYVTIEKYQSYWVLYHLTMKPEKYFVIDQDIEPNEYMDDFGEICDIVEKHYSLAEYKSISLKSLRDKYSAMVMNARDNREYFLAVQQYFSELKNSHTNLIYKKYPSNN